MKSASTFGRVDSEFAQLRKLTEISRALTYTTSVDQVTRLTVERGADLLGASAAVLMLADSEGLLHVLAAHGIPDERRARFQAPLDDEVIGRLQGLLEVPDECVISVPLIAGGAVTGLLSAGMRRPPNAADETLLSALADQAAVALENARLGGEVRMEMEERLRVSEGATTAKDRALATLAHDIRTPLGAIDGYCAIMQDELYGPINDRQRETLGRVRMSGRHLLSLLDNVMEMARLNAGVLRLESEPVRLMEAARESVQMVTPAADAKLLSLQLGRLADVVVTGDPARLRQVLVNLVGNAVKFTPPDGSVIVTTAVTDAEDGRWGEVRVADTGPGIPAAEQASIFEPYYRSENTAALPGIGLGLAISQALVKQMGGEMRMESEVGVGSTFIVRLPLLEGDTGT